MALLNKRPADQAQTNFGSDRQAAGIAIESKDGTASFIALVSPSGDEWLLWVDDTGDLRLSTRAQYEAVVGAVVGDQTA